MTAATLVRSQGEREFGRLPRRLMRHMQWAAILTHNEARSAIVAHRQRDGRWGGSEAVVHYGGATAVIQAAIRLRHRHRHNALKET